MRPPDPGRETGRPTSRPVPGTTTPTASPKTISPKDTPGRRHGPGWDAIAASQRAYSRWWVEQERRERERYRRRHGLAPITDADLVDVAADLGVDEATVRSVADILEALLRRAAS